MSREFFLLGLVLAGAGVWVELDEGRFLIAHGLLVGGTAMASAALTQWVWGRRR